MDLFHQALSKANAFPHGLYWTVPKGSNPAEPVQELIKDANKYGIDAHIVETETYDTLLLRIWRNLPDKPQKMNLKVHKASSRSVSIPIPERVGSEPYLRFNALPVKAVPSQCLSVKLKSNPKWVDLARLLRERDNNLVATIGENLMVWGSESEIRTVFDDVLSIDEISFEPDWRASGELHTKRFLQDAIGKAFAHTRPLIARRRAYGVYLIVDSMADGVNLFEPLRSQVGIYKGTIPGLRIPETENHPAVNKVDFAGAVLISLSYCDDRLWLLMKPDIWIWPTFARPAANRLVASSKIQLVQQ